MPIYNRDFDAPDASPTTPAAPLPPGVSYPPGYGPPPSTPADPGKRADNGNKRKTDEPKQPKKAEVRPPETIEQAVGRMFAEGWNPHRIHDQIKRWHPNWSEYQIDQVMMRAPKSPKQSGEATRPMLAPSDEAWVKKHRRDTGTDIGKLLERVAGNAERELRSIGRKAANSKLVHDTIKHDAREIHASARVEKVVIRDTASAAKTIARVGAEAAASVVHHDARYIREAAKYSKAVAADLKNNPADLAAAASFLALASPPPLDAAFLVIAAVASVEAGEKARRQGHYAEMFLDYTAALTGGLGGSGARLGEALQEARVAKSSSGLTKLAREAIATSPPSEPALTLAERAKVARFAGELAAARTGAKTARIARMQSDLAATVLAGLADPRLDPALKMESR